MRRRLFTVLSAVSLLLCVATCFLGARGHALTDMVTFSACRSGFSIQSIQGHILFAWYPFSVGPWFHYMTWVVQE